MVRSSIEWTYKTRLDLAAMTMRALPPCLPPHPLVYANSTVGNNELCDALAQTVTCTSLTVCSKRIQQLKSVHLYKNILLYMTVYVGEFTMSMLALPLRKCNSFTILHLIVTRPVFLNLSHRQNNCTLSFGAMKT